MIGGTVCSGIGAPEVASVGMPIDWAWTSEIDPFASAVLAHRLQGVPNRGDFTKIESGAIDLLVGGTPCQSFSVAGLRGGMADHRGNLAIEFLRLAGRLRPAWVVWENVPGVLSSGAGRDFGSFLGGLAKLGYGFAYRVLDAQFFGVPQRRRRVFVVGHSRDWRRAAAVLFERHSLSGNPPPRREAGASVAGSLDSRASGGGFPGTDGACGGHIVAGSLTARYGKGTDSDATDALCVTYTLRADGFDASEDGTGRGTPLVVTPFDRTQITSDRNYSNPKPGDPCHPMAATAHVPAIAFACATQDRRSGQGWNSNIVAPDTTVRRLTPRECERLQGFPDDYTLVEYRGKPASDGPRYKALGNSMAVPVMRWILTRLITVDGRD